MMADYEPGALVKLIERTDHAFALRMHERYAFPQRWMLGHNGNPTPMTLANKAEALTEYCRRGILHAPTLDAPSEWFTQKKEIPMIEKKNFVTPPVKTPAGSLAHRHLGSLVTITLPSGAEITDVLVGVRVGRMVGQVGIDLRNITHNSHDIDFLLDPKSVVLVRRPKAVKAPAKKARR